MQPIMDLSIFETLEERQVPNSKTTKFVERDGEGADLRGKNKKKWEVEINRTVWELSGRIKTKTVFENTFRIRFR